MNIQRALRELIKGNNLTQSDMAEVMHQIMTGNCTQVQIGGFLTALAIKGETVDEVVGAVEVMRSLATRVDVNTENLVDTCGTGGDSASLFNVSTAAAIVVAAAGGRVAKHGNRSITSSSGSADVLECAGVNLQLSAREVALCVEQLGVGFMFAVNHHGAMKHAIGPRQELGIKTVFNLLGPLTNPASAPNQVIGLSTKSWLRPYAEVLRKLGARHVMVVHSHDGLDEISISAKTDVCELVNGEIREYSVDPKELNVAGDISCLSVDSAQQSLDIINAAFAGEHEDALNIIAVNAGAALYVSEVCRCLADGIAMAKDVMLSGAAASKFESLIMQTNKVKELEIA